MVNEKRMMEEFRKLASFDSESYCERDIAEYLFKRLEELGLEVTMDDAGHKLRENEKAAGNIYGIMKGEKGSEPILLSAHMDTVSPGRGKKVLMAEDGRVTSDGTSVLGADDITGIVSILEALEVVRENGTKHPDIEVVFFVAEEPYCKGSSFFDFSRVLSKQAYVFDLTGAVGTIANEAPSIIQFTAKVRGKSAHAGFEPEKGISAIAVAAQSVSQLSLGRIDKNTTANVGVINGGAGRNIVPEEAVVEGEIRSLCHEKALSVVNDIKTVFERTAEDFGAAVCFTVEEMIRAYRVSPQSEVIRRYEHVLDRLGYGKPTIVTTFGGSDNNNFNKHGIEGIVVSNAMNRVHTKEEFFYVDELVKSAEIATGILIL